MVSLRYLKKSGAKSNDHVYVRCNQSKAKIHIEFFSNLRFVLEELIQAGRLAIFGDSIKSTKTRASLVTGTKQETGKPKIEKEETG